MNYYSAMWGKNRQTLKGLRKEKELDRKISIKGLENSKKSLIWNKATFWVTASMLIIAIVGAFVGIFSYARNDSNLPLSIDISNTPENISWCPQSWLGVNSNLPNVDDIFKTSDIINKNSSPWGLGTSRFIFSTSGITSYTLIDFKITGLERVEEPPQWYYKKDFGACGGVGDAVITLQLNADSGKLRRIILSEQDRPASGLFNPTSITRDSTITLDIITLSCQNSHKFNVELNYKKSNEDEVTTRIFGPYIVYAAMTASPLYIEKSPGNLIPSPWEGNTETTSLCDS